MFAKKVLEMGVREIDDGHVPFLRSAVIICYEHQERGIITSCITVVGVGVGGGQNTREVLSSNAPPIVPPLNAPRMTRGIQKLQ